MLRNWFCTAVIVGATALALLTPDTSFAQRGGRGGRGGWGGGRGGWDGGRWDGGWDGRWGVGVGWGWGGGYGGYYAPGYGGYYGDGYASPYNPSYTATGTYASPLTYDANYYNPGITPASYDRQNNVARVMVRVPSPDAKVEFGEKWTQQKGTTRLFVSPPLEAGNTYTYHITARWTDNSGREIERERNVKVQPGQQASVDFSQPLQQGETVGQPNPNRDGQNLLDKNRERTDQIDRDRQPQRDRDRQIQPDRNKQPQPDRDRQPQQDR